MSYLPAMNRIEVGTVLRPSLQEQRHDVKLSLNFHLPAEAVRAGSLEVVLHRLIVPGGVDLRPASPQPVQVNFVAAPLLRVRAIWLRCKSQLDGPPSSRTRSISNTSTPT